MDFISYSHGHADAIIKSTSNLQNLWIELTETINEISDLELIQHFESSNRRAKSISESINKILDKKLVEKGWKPQSRIFKDRDTYQGTTWTLDFSKQTEGYSHKKLGMAIEVVFNHGEAIAWNLIKLSISAEDNQLRKETDIGDGIGVYICATEELKKSGGFDNAVGEYEKVLKYLDPLSLKIKTPIMIVGLSKPKTFEVEHFRDPRNQKRVLGRIVKT
jgi:hypothetical protein